MAPHLRPLAEQVIVVTSSGIGLVTARMAAAQGAAVVAAARNGEALETLVEEIRGRGGRAIRVFATWAERTRSTTSPSGRCRPSAASTPG
jgi:NADP-dependent 3-hydroxy acid dehydrogenase YdfG